MNDWKKYKIEEIGAVIGGGTPSTQIPEYWEGNIPWLTPRDLSGNKLKYISIGERHISAKGLANSNAKTLPKGTVLLSSRAPIGYLAIAERELTTNQGFQSIIPNSKTTTEFLYYLLSSNIEYLKSQGEGTTFGELSKTTLKNISFNFPSISEQKEIAEILCTLDDKIILLLKQNNILEKLAETLFRQFFVIEIEDNWEVKKLNDIISVKGGTTPSTKQPEFWDGQIHWTSPKDLTNQTSIFMFDTQRKITEKGLAQIGSGLLPIGTLLLSSRAPIGYLAITDIPTAINQGYIAIICNKYVSNYYMYLWCKYNMPDIENAGNGSVFQEISKSTFKELKVILPPICKLEKFKTQVEPLFEKMKSNSRQIHIITLLRDNLLPKLMNGVVKVKMKK